MSEVPYPEFPNERPFENFVERLLQSVGVKMWNEKPKWENPFKPWNVQKK